MEITMPRMGRRRRRLLGGGQLGTGCWRPGVPRRCRRRPVHSPAALAPGTDQRSRNHPRCWEGEDAPGCWLHRRRAGPRDRRPRRHRPGERPAAPSVPAGSGGRRRRRRGDRRGRSGGRGRKQRNSRSIVPCPRGPSQRAGDMLGTPVAAPRSRSTRTGAAVTRR
ncbi:hypothetical protein QJS66_08325 [Kocuria rhizophila]|nr:hypothetical protein QJS66_08325 [Kocuria rhizophila]